MAANASLAATMNTRITGKTLVNTIKDGDIQRAHRQKEASQYICDMILELRNMAKANQLFQVMVPLEYAYYEAFSAANQMKAPPEEVERLRELGKVSESLEAEIQDY
jgi:hypothetical protein